MCRCDQTIFPVYIEQNDLDLVLDDIDLDCNPEDAPIYMGHSLFNIKKRITFTFIVQSLFDGPDIAVHLISGLKLSALQSRSSFYSGQNFSIQILTIQIILLRVNEVIERSESGCCSENR